MCGDENNSGHKGDVLNYSLMSLVDLEPYNYEQAYTNNAWMK